MSDQLHYSDGSHRWVPADPRTNPDAWAAKVREHQKTCDTSRVERRMSQNSACRTWRRQ